MNAYELADLNDWACCANSKEVSAMLRQQADRIADLETTLAFKKMKPLSDEEVRQIQAQCHLRNVGYDTFLMRFARIIELRHGIK